jgi:hypothetical protein
VPNEKPPSIVNGMWDHPAGVDHVKWGRDAARGSRSGRSSILFPIAAAIALIGIAVHPACAQQAGGQPLLSPISQPVQPATGQDGVEVLVTPYGWVPWVGTGVNPSRTRAPSTYGTVDPYKLISHNTWVPFMGQVEFRDGPFGILADYIHAPVKAGINTRNIVFGGGGTGLSIDTGTAMFLYRPLSQPNQYVDVGIGLRAWGIGGTISLNQALASAVNVTNGEA